MKTLHLSIVTIVGIIVIAMATLGVFLGKLNDNPQYPSQYAPSPMPLTKLWGPQVTSFDHAKSITNLSKTSLPSYMPAELSIGSIRASGNSIGVDLIPKNMTAQENDTIQQVLGNGGIIIIYSQEPNPSRVNETTWMHNFVNQSPQTTHLDEINGHPSIIWNAQKNGVVILRSDIMVDIESIKYNSTELKKIAQSILP